MFRLIVSEHLVFDLDFYPASHGTEAHFKTRYRHNLGNEFSGTLVYDLGQVRYTFNFTPKSIDRIEAIGIESLALTIHGPALYDLITGVRAASDRLARANAAVRDSRQRVEEATRVVDSAQCKLDAALQEHEQAKLYLEKVGKITPETVKRCFDDVTSPTH
jgi:hypothetical protein